MPRQHGEGGRIAGPQHQGDVYRRQAPGGGGQQHHAEGGQQGGQHQPAQALPAAVAEALQGGRLVGEAFLSQQAKGALASLLLMAILGGLALVAWGGWRLQRQYQPDLRGVRHPHPHALPGRLLAALLPLSGLLGALLLAGLARSAPPQMDALGNSLGLALAACALGAAVCLLWLACGPARGDGWVWLPLVLPALPLADGQYRLALYAWLDGDWRTVLWGHLLWVVPWMLFILRPAWRQRDPRLTVVARTLGWGSTRIFWLLTLPSLTRPLLTALAVGFSVSIAQYLPTLWLGAGRIPTLTSQAVALSSGGEAQTLAAQALWQLLLPAVCFTLTALLAWLAGRYRRGLR